MSAKESEIHFSRRLGRTGEHLRACLAGLYGPARGAELYDSLIHTLRSFARVRPEALRALDLAREAKPDWFLQSDMIGYSAYVDRFAGDLPGLRQRIDYLSGLGVRYLHLLPFWKARPGDSDGGFAVSDYNAVREDLGHIDDLDAVTEAMREANISLCADLVLNHTADDHPWAVAARLGETQYRDYFHILASEDEVAAYEANLPQIFPTTAPGNFTFSPEMGGWVWTTFYPFQWDLNWSNPAVFSEFVSIILGLANRGVEAFRLDSAAFLWKRPGTICRNEPETHLVLQAMRAIVAIAAPSVLLMSEVIAPVAETAEFLGSEETPECHLTYHSGLMTAGWAALAEEDAALARAVIAETPAIPGGAGWVTYVRCHDDIGWMTLAPQASDTREGAEIRLRRVAERFTSGADYARGVNFQTADGGSVHGLNGTAASLVGLQAAGDAESEALAIDRLALLYSLACAAGGIPMLNMGDELGQTNDDSFVNDPLRAHEGRWLHRPLFDEGLAKRSSNPADLPGKINRRLVHLFNSRHGLPALSPDNAPKLVEVGGPAILAFSRGPSVVALFNFSRTNQSVTLAQSPALGWRDLLSGEPVSGEIELGPYGSAWLQKAPQ